MDNHILNRVNSCIRARKKEQRLKFDDLIKSHEFNHRWLSKKVHIPPPNPGGIKRRIIFSDTRLYM